MVQRSRDGGRRHTPESKRASQHAGAKIADLVLSGGGVKGIGLVGAVAALMDAGYRVGRVSGTSAGSLVGAVVAAGARGPGSWDVEVAGLDGCGGLERTRYCAAALLHEWSLPGVGSR